MKLPLAVDIAVCVAEATQAGVEVNVIERAHELAAGHPEAETSPAEVEETLQEELLVAQPVRSIPLQAGR